ncbi:hypothetical protein [Chryseobacterium sp. KCF3-3]|uniref:hypothetical protein n=1 Tax=Chryseobacterium sp. KCF3-3 TaxID=3231511 RepID=UPI0038B3FECA
MKDEDYLYKLSSDLELSKFNENEYLLYNSKFNKYTKIGRKYYDLLVLADGSRTIPEINAAFQKNHRIFLSDVEIISLFDKLKQYGIFDYHDSIKEHEKIPDYIKFGFIFLTSNVISRIVPLLKFVFNKYFFYAIAIMYFIILGLNLYENYHEYDKLNIKKIFPYFLLLTFIASILHELGHATASYYYKAKHGGIGFGFYLYFIPAFFADVTDVWRLIRWKRIVVNSAGVYFEIIFCLLLTMTGFFTKNQSVEVLALVISGTALYNLLPFLRADGYWILSDLLDKPNLNFHSMNNLKLILISFLNRKKLSFSRKDYLIALYGVFNILIICIFFYYQLFLNWGSIVSFPGTIYYVIISIFKRDLLMSFYQLVKMITAFLFYLIAFKILIKVFKNALR